MKQEAPKATPKQLTAVFSRNAEVPDCPERRLVLGVLSQSLDDLVSRSVSASGYRSAVEFWQPGGGHIEWCDVIGLNPEFARELVVRHLPEGR